MILTIGLAILLLVSLGVIVHVLRDNDRLERQLYNQTYAVHRYSKESLDRFEEIFKLREQIVELENKLTECGTKTTTKK